MTSRELTNLAADLVSDGFAGHDAAVRDVVCAARLHGVRAVLVDILADPDQPEVARQRAFGNVAAALAADSSSLPADAPATRRAA